MKNIEYIYWEINYISCEGNKRWTVVRTPIEWIEYDVRDSLTLGGIGDDISEIVEIFETNDKDYGWDFCNE